MILAGTILVWLFQLTYTQPYLCYGCDTCVCGSDGHTYEHDRYLKIAKIGQPTLKQLYKGPCLEDQDDYSSYEPSNYDYEPSNVIKKSKPKDLAASHTIPKDLFVNHEFRHLKAPDKITKYDHYEKRYKCHMTHTQGKHTDRNDKLKFLYKLLKSWLNKLSDSDLIDSKEELSEVTDRKKQKLSYGEIFEEKDPDGSKKKSHVNISI